MTFALITFYPLQIQVLTPDTIFFHVLLIVPVIINAALYYTVSILSEKRNY